MEATFLTFLFLFGVVGADFCAQEPLTCLKVATRFALKYDLKRVIFHLDERSLSIDGKKEIIQWIKSVNLTEVAVFCGFRGEIGGSVHILADKVSEESAAEGSFGGDQAEEGEEGHGELGPGQKLYLIGRNLTEESERQLR